MAHFCFRFFQRPGNLRRALPADGDPGLRVPQAVAVVPRQPLRLLHGRLLRPSPHLPVRKRERQPCKINLPGDSRPYFRAAGGIVPHVSPNAMPLFDALLMRRRDVVAGIDTDY